MNRSEWASYRSALKTLDEAPKRIAAAKADYRAADEYMRDPAHRRNWSQAGIENHYAAAREKRENTISAEVAKMRKALDVVRTYNRFPAEEVDLSSTKLQNALTIINTMKDKLPNAQQISILNNFRGEPAALQFLGDVFDANGLYYSQLAREMIKPISNEALENAEYCVNAYELTGDFPEEKMYWTKGAFAEQMERLGIDSGAADPFVTALKSMRGGENPEAQRIISAAIYKIANSPSMTDTDKANLIDSVTKQIDFTNTAREDKEIKSQARAYDALQGLEGTSQEMEAIIADVYGGNE